MHRIRQATLADLPPLMELAKSGNFINLPPQENQLRGLLESAERSFAVAKAEAPPADYDRSKHLAIFVLETPDGDVIGTSGIRFGMGDSNHPNLSFQLINVVRRSESLRKEETLGVGELVIMSGESEHVYAVLFQDTNSPTELGGNVIHRDHRGGGHGKLLSYGRFQYMHRRPSFFSDRIMAEMMAPIDPYNDGNTFWRHVARRFINLSYENADRLSTVRERREFMYNLLPPMVNLSLLEEDVLEFLGAVGPQTKGAARMLADIGFRYVHRVDPFDAGAHLEMRLSQCEKLPSVSAKARALPTPPPWLTEMIVSADDPDRGFRAVRCRGGIGDDPSELQLDDDVRSTLEIDEGERVMYARLDFVRAPGHPMPLPEVNLDREHEQMHPHETAPLVEAAIGPVAFGEIIERTIEQIRAEFGA
ncbi:MAG: arginine N-succinyltransferase [Planctomycetota bacterium]